MLLRLRKPHEVEHAPFPHQNDAAENYIVATPTDVPAGNRAGNATAPAGLLLPPTD
jgi:hypothetical protein